MNIFKIFSKKKSGMVAKDRLRLLLVSDRAATSPELMDMMKYDILNVISKYMEIDSDACEFGITKTTNGNGIKVPCLYANIPIKELTKKY